MAKRYLESMYNIRLAQQALAEVDDPELRQKELSERARYDAGLSHHQSEQAAKFFDLFKK